MSQTTASRPALRVALADDAALFRQGLALLLAEAGFTVTARVGDAQALLAGPARVVPERMPGRPVSARATAVDLNAASLFKIGWSYRAHAPAVGSS